MATVARVRHIDARDKTERARFVWLERDLVGADPMYVPEIRADVDKRLRGR